MSQNEALLREVRLFENHHEREQMENMSELYAVINSLECLEKMFSRDFINAQDYQTECYKLLDQYKVAMRLVRGTEVDAFMAKYRMQCPAALVRINEGKPITMRDDKGNTLKTIAEIVELRLNMRAVDQIFPYVNDLLSHINACSRLPEDFDGKLKVKRWHEKFNTMTASEELTEDDSRQMIFDFEIAYSQFMKFLNEKK